MLGKGKKGKCLIVSSIFFLVLIGDLAGFAKTCGTQQAQILFIAPPIHQSTDNIVWFKAVNTGSMRPTLDDKTKLGAVPAESAQVGDIAIFARDGKEIIHRVIGIGIDEQGLFYTTKGDHNSQADDIKWRSEELKYVVVTISYLP